MPTIITKGEFYTNGVTMRRVDLIEKGTNKIRYTAHYISGEKSKGKCSAKALIKWAKGIVQRYVKVKRDDDWIKRTFNELKKGDYFKIFDPDSAKLIHKTGDTWLATGDPEDVKGVPQISTKEIASEVENAE